jgi:hypothetical protein
MDSDTSYVAHNLDIVASGAPVWLGDAAIVFIRLMYLFEDAEVRGEIPEGAWDVFTWPSDEIRPIEVMIATIMDEYDRHASPSESMHHFLDQIIFYDGTIHRHPNGSTPTPIFPASFPIRSTNTDIWS